LENINPQVTWRNQLVHYQSNKHKAKRKVQLEAALWTRKRSFSVLPPAWSVISDPEPDPDLDLDAAHFQKVHILDA
jgi:hypothetical protein